MAENPVVVKVTDLIMPIISDLGLELYDLEFTGGKLRITVDTPPGSPGGVDVDRLSRCTRLISRDLDHEDPIPGHYTLEVSSPGLERNLRLPRHFEREIGKTIAVRLRDAIGGERRLNGLLTSASAESFTMRLDNGDERQIPYDLVDKARTVFVWPAQERKTPSKGKPSRTASSRSGGTSTSKSTASPAESRAENNDSTDDDEDFDEDEDFDDIDDIDDIDEDDENDNNEDQEHSKS